VSAPDGHAGGPGRARGADAAPRFAAWRERALRLWLTAGTSAVGAAGSLLRNKWLALHFEPGGLGVLGQVLSGQVWLGTFTALGLGVPVARAVGAALGRDDPEAVRRTMSTALALLGAAALTVAALGLALAPWISVAILGEARYADLVRISMLAVGGLAFQSTIQGLFAGHSDVRAPLTYAVAGNVATLVLLLALVPRHGLAGAVWAVAAFWPAALAAALWIHRRRYAAAFAPAPRPRFDRAEARALLTVAAAALTLSLLDQGAMLAIRAHVVRASGLEANGFIQAGIAVSQQLGSVFYAYLGGYAFGRISGLAGAAAVRDYTRRQWGPLVGLAFAACAVTTALAGPLLHLLYSARFEPARPVLSWMLVGEFGKVAMQVWALGALPLGGLRLWFPLGLAWPLGMAACYAAAHAAGAGAMELPYAYAGTGTLALALTAWRMSRRGVTLRAHDAALGFGGLAALAAAAWFTNR